MSDKLTSAQLNVRTVLKNEQHETELNIKVLERAIAGHRNRLSEYTTELRHQETRLGCIATGLLAFKAE